MLIIAVAFILLALLAGRYYLTQQDHGLIKPVLERFI